MAELVVDLPPPGHGLVLARQQQGARHQRLAEFGEQRLSYNVPGDPHSHGLLSRVLQPARYLLGRGQDERVTARGRRLDSPEHPVGDVHELAELGEVTAHQREVVPVIKVADRPDPRDPVPVAQLAAERVARVRRVGDHATLPDDLHRMPDQSRLRVLRVHRKVLGHALVIRAETPAPELAFSQRAANAPTWTTRGSTTRGALAGAPARSGFRPARGNRHREKRGTHAPAPRVATSHIAPDGGCR